MVTIASSEWEKLFPNESWNKFPSNELAVYSGTLQRKVQEPPGYLQRENMYQINTGSDLIDVYTGGAQITSKYLNQKVNIKGKLEEFELEGQQIREIFPLEIQLQ